MSYEGKGFYEKSSLIVLFTGNSEFIFTCYQTETDYAIAHVIIIFMLKVNYYQFSFYFRHYKTKDSVV